MLSYYYITENQRDNKIHSPKEMHKKIETTPQNSIEFFRMVQVLKEQAKNQNISLPFKKLQYAIESDYRR